MTPFEKFQKGREFVIAAAGHAKAPAVIVCVRAQDGAWKFAPLGSSRRSCSRCMCEVVVTPQSARLQRQKKLYVLCYVCHRQRATVLGTDGFSESFFCPWTVELRRKVIVRGPSSSAAR